MSAYVADEEQTDDDTPHEIGAWIHDVALSRVRKQSTTVLIDGKRYRVTVEEFGEETA